MKHSYTIKADKLGDFEKTLPRRYSQALTRAHDLAAKDIVAKLAKATEDAGPTHAGGPTGAVATGKLMRGWKAIMIKRDLRVEIRNSARDVNRAYQSLVEYGNKPGGSMPPAAAILRWMRAVGIASHNMKSAAFLISRAIRRRGIKARLIMYGPSGSRMAGFAKTHYKYLRAEMAKELDKA